jgi:NCAIR mutase (PurE)-related protein
MKFPQNQKWVSIKVEELNKRIEQKKLVHTKEQLEWNKERQMRRAFQEADSKESTDKKGESSSNVWVLSNAHLGKLLKMRFWAFYISFISNT